MEAYNWSDILGDMSLKAVWTTENTTYHFSAAEGELISGSNEISVARSERIPASDVPVAKLTDKVFRYWKYVKGVSSDLIDQVWSNDTGFGIDTRDVYLEAVYSDPAITLTYYYVDLKTGIRALGLRNINGDEYYFHPSTGAMQYGLQIINRQYYYFDPISGVKQKGSVNLEDDNFLLDENTGAVKLGFVKKGDKTYYVKVESNRLVLQKGEAAIGGKNIILTLVMVELCLSAGAMMKTKGT